MIYLAIQCPDPPEIMNGTRMFTGNLLGDTAIYTCDLDFELLGKAMTTCTQVSVFTAEFLPAPPVCSREYCMQWLEFLSVLG